MHAGVSCQWLFRDMVWDQWRSSATRATESVLTLTNLVRLGNENVTKALNLFNFPNLREAAKVIILLSTRGKKSPYLKQELFGSRALDALWETLMEWMTGIWRSSLFRLSYHQPPLHHYRKWIVHLKFGQYLWSEPEWLTKMMWITPAKKWGCTSVRT